MRTSPKRLSIHAIPIIMMVTVILVASVVMLNRYDSGSPTEDAISRALASRLVHVAQTSNGLSKVELYLSSNAANTEPYSGLNYDLTQLGRSTQLSFELQ